MASKLDILQDWFQRVWIGGELDRIGDYFTPASQASGLMTGLEMRPDEFRELVPALRFMLDEPELRIERHVETPDWLWALINVRARAADSQQPLEFSGQMMIRFEGNRFAEAFNHFDMIAMFEQLGALPPETMALCLSGERLG